MNSTFCLNCMVRSDYYIVARSSLGNYNHEPQSLVQCPCDCVGTEDYLLAVSNGDIAVANEYVEEPAPPASLEFLQLAEFLLRERALQMPSSIEEAIKLYLTLVDIIDI